MDEWDLLHMDLYGGGQSAAGGDEWDQLHSQLYGGGSGQDLSGLIGGEQAEIRSNYEPRSLPAEFAVGAGEGLALTAGLVGDAALTAGQLGFGALTGSSLGYSPGSFISQMGEDYNRLFPRREDDPTGVRTAASFMTPGGVIAGAGRAAMKRGGGKVAEFFGRNAGRDTAGSITGGIAAGASEEVFPDSPGLQAGAGLLGVFPGTIGYQAAKKSIPAIPKIPTSRQAAQELASETGQKLKGALKDADAAVPAKAESMAVHRLTKAAGGDVEMAKFIQAIDEIQPNQIDNLSSVAESLIDHPEAGSAAARIAGYLRKMEKDADPDLMKRFVDFNARKQAGRDQVLSEMGSPGMVRASSGDALQRGRGQADEAREAVEGLYNAIDPEGTSRIAILSEKTKLQDTLKQFPTGFEGKTKQLLDTFLDKTQDGMGAVNVKSWAMLNDLRSRARDIANQKPGTRDAKVMHQLSDLITEAGERAARDGKGFTPQQAEAWGQASDAWASYKNTFGAPDIARMLDPRKTDPSKIAPKFLSSSTTVEGAKRMLKVVPKEDLPEFRRGIVDEIISKATTATDTVGMAKVAKEIRANSDKLHTVMSKTHVDNLEKLARGMARQRKTQELANKYAPSFEKGSVKTHFEHMKDLISGRVAWRYPIKRKIIQVAAHSGKTNLMSFDDITNKVIFELAHDPVAAKMIVGRYKPELVDSSQFQSLVDQAVERSKSLLGPTADFVVGGPARKLPIAGAVAGRDLTVEE
jgi:hypothetical protein